MDRIVPGTGEVVCSDGRGTTEHAEDGCLEDPRFARAGGPLKGSGTSRPAIVGGGCAAGPMLAPTRAATGDGMGVVNSAPTLSGAVNRAPT